MGKWKSTLLIGDIAALTGSSPSTLRFWEDQGIVEPEKDERNQYRRYTPEDTCRFLFARKYRSFGVPLPEVPALMSAGDEVRSAAFGACRDRFDAEIARLSAARDSLDRFIADCREARGLLGRFVPGERPASHFFPYVEKGGLRDGRNSFAQDWLSRLPAIDYVVCLDPSRPTGETSFTCQWGFGAGDAVFRSFSEKVRSRAVFLPVCRCLRTAVLRESPRDFTEAEYAALLGGVAAQGCSLGGPVIGHILAIDGNASAPRYLISLFLPMKE